MKEFAIHLDSTSEKPLYEQIYDAIRDGILTGHIPTGEKLPSTRFEASYLSCSRSTVELAYDQLLSEGYITSQPYRGYYVCEVGELYHLTGQMPEVIKPSAETSKKESFFVDFSPNGIELEKFPFEATARIMRNLLLDDGEEMLKSSEPSGEEDLRQAICEYLFRSRNVRCAPEQIIVGAGHEYLLLLLGQILGAGHSIAMESPTYVRAYDAFRAIDYSVEEILMDAEGMRTELLAASQADVAYVMPSHQFPTGTVMPLRRRMELLAWANSEKGRYIIEDDYDSEFRYKGKPIPALQGMDRNGRVIYMGTFSRSIAPSLRVGYLVLPAQLLSIYRKRCGFYACTVPTLMQKTIAQFMREGHFEKNLNRMRGIYKAKHDAMVAELKKRDWVLRVFGENSGLHLLVEVDTARTEQELIAACREKGVRIFGLSDYFLSKSVELPKPILLLGYGGLTADKMRVGLGIIEQALK